MTTFISPALISRVFGAIEQHNRAHALTLLRQAFFVQRNGIVEDNQFITELEHMADKCVKKGDMLRAESYYRLALELYENCFTDQHLQAICCFGGLAKAIQAQSRKADMAELMRWDDLILQRVRDAEKGGAPIITLFDDRLVEAERRSA